MLMSCTNEDKVENSKENKLPDQFLVVLGIAQDAGYPQAGCYKMCCVDKAATELVSCLGIVDQSEQKVWIIDATPDFKAQLKHLQSFLKNPNQLPSGIFLTHAHMGHYTGLIHLGREAIGSESVTVGAMPEMSNFLQTNGPWEQLVKLNNIEILPLSDQGTIQLSSSISLQPIRVPHRDEYSETVGYKIFGQDQSVLYIPDIDKWGKWEKDIMEECKTVDHVFLDGTFYKNGELPNRDMSEIPHPFIEESIDVLKELPQGQRKNIHFIHLNHTNPLLNNSSKEFKEFKQSGFSLAETGEIISLGK